MIYEDPVSKTLIRQVHGLRDQHATLVQGLEAQGSLYNEQQFAMKQLLDRIHQLEKESSGHSRELFDTQAQILVINGRLTLVEGVGSTLATQTRKLDAVAGDLSRLQQHHEATRTGLANLEAGHSESTQACKEELAELRRSLDLQLGDGRAELDAVVEELSHKTDALVEKLAAVCDECNSLAQLCDSSNAVQSELRESVENDLAALEDMACQHIERVASEVAAQTAGTLEGQMRAQVEELEAKMATDHDALAAELASGLRTCSEAAEGASKGVARLSEEVARVSSDSGIALNQSFEDLNKKLGDVWEELARSSAAQFKFQNTYYNSMLDMVREPSPTRPANRKRAGAGNLPPVPGYGVELAGSIVPASGG